MEVFKRGTGILPVENVRSPMKRRKESRARCPCHAISQVPQLERKSGNFEPGFGHLRNNLY